MASARHTHTLLLVPLLLAAATTMAAALATASSELMTMSTIHARVAAELASSSSSDDDSCWGSPEECPVVYDVDAEGGGGAGGATPRGRMRLQLYDDVNTAASLLPTADYITYSALMPDSVPCSVPGASYYNCQPGAEVNPYTRGCTAITQCRG